MRGVSEDGGGEECELGFYKVKKGRIELENCQFITKRIFVWSRWSYSRKT